MNYDLVKSNIGSDLLDLTKGSTYVCISTTMGATNKGNGVEPVAYTVIDNVGLPTTIKAEHCEKLEGSCGSPKRGSYSLKNGEDIAYEVDNILDSADIDKGTPEHEEVSKYIYTLVTRNLKVVKALAFEFGGNVDTVNCIPAIEEYFENWVDKCDLPLITRGEVSEVDVFIFKNFKYWVGSLEGIKKFYKLVETLDDIFSNERYIVEGIDSYMYKKMLH